MTFNDHEGSTKSYAYVKDHDVVLHTADYIAGGRDIAVDYEPGTVHDVELEDGSHVLLRKLEIDYDPTDSDRGDEEACTSTPRPASSSPDLLYVDTHSEDLCSANSCRNAARALRRRSAANHARRLGIAHARLRRNAR